MKSEVLECGLGVSRGGTLCFSGVVGTVQDVPGDPPSCERVESGDPAGRVGSNGWCVPCSDAGVSSRMGSFLVTNLRW